MLMHYAAKFVREDFAHGTKRVELLVNIRGQNAMVLGNKIKIERDSCRRSNQRKRGGNGAANSAT